LRCTATGVFEGMNDRHPRALQAALDATSRRAVKPVKIDKAETHMADMLFGAPLDHA
jgi:hypothetical protein